MADQEIIAQIVQYEITVEMDGYPPGGLGSSARGGITGTLSAQTDLWAFLQNKANSADLADVAFSGDKADIGLGNVDNTSDIDKPVSTAQASADTTVLNNAKAYAEGLVVNLWDDRGGFTPSGSYPSTGGSGTLGAIAKGDIWTVTGLGSNNTALVGTETVEDGDTVRALVNNPGQTNTNWSIQQNNIGYRPENIANKSIDINADQASSIKYPTVKSVYDRVVGLFSPVNSHIANTSNPHSVTKSQVGLGSVDNTADTDKPVSTAQATAINAKMTKPSSPINNGIITSDASGNAKVTSATIDAVGNASGFASMNTNILGINTVQIRYSVADTASGSNARMAFPNGPTRRLTNAGLVSVGAMAASYGDAVFMIHNHTGNTITILNEDTSNTASERFVTGTGSNYTMPPKAMVSCQYSASDSRRHLISTN